MKSYRSLILFIIIASVFGLSQCRKDIEEIVNNNPPKAVATPYDFKVPEGFPEPFIPADNPMTVEGVELGRFLFYDKRLSRDLSMSCGSCHGPYAAFSDPQYRRFSEGIHGHKTRRNTMPLFNLAWQQNFFWDGRATSLEEQAAMPVVDQMELANDWPTVLSRLEADSIYPDMFRAAFGDDDITMERTTKAIAQFERSIVSANSEFDQVVRLKTKAKFDPQQTGDANIGYRDFALEARETFDCFHCHGIEETSFLMGAYGRDLQFLNNGLQTEEEMKLDGGREEATGNPNDRGKFKVPSLRNLITHPFMHDGSIPHLDSLVEFYNFGGHKTSTVDPNMEKAGIGRNWTPEQKENLAAFLKTMIDWEFLENPAYSNPYEE